MGYDLARSRLSLTIAQLREAFTGLDLAIADKPVDGDDALVDHFADATTSALGEVEEAGRRANALDRGDLSALAQLHTLLLNTMRRFHGDIASTARIRALTQMAHRRSGEWPSWARVVQTTCDQVWAALFAACGELDACLNELAERQQALGSATIHH
jgi:hypothetical protein